MIEQILLVLQRELYYLKAGFDRETEKPLWIWNFTGVVFWDDIYFDRGEEDEIYNDGNESVDYVYFPLKKNIEIICF